MRSPVFAAIIGPIVEPQGQSFLTMNSCNGRDDGNGGDDCNQLAESSRYGCLHADLGEARAHNHAMIATIIT